ncbi:MAG: voltage-gated potassium channel [Sphingobacteriales bacterium]|jgi:voltage-gated potassium channel
MTKREQLYQIISKADSPAGKRFNVLIFWAIILSVLVVFLESVPDYQESYGSWFLRIEWIFTFLFSLEYLIRIYTAPNRLKYITSFFGLVDLLSILPTFLGVFISGTQSLMVIRSLRLMRVFRVLKLAAFLKESDQLRNALKSSRPKIIVFLVAILCISTITGTLMYLIESPEAGFTSIPRSIYWTIVTLTTVGYGDIAPVTVVGQFLASILMIMGYAIIAVPTGIITKEIVTAGKPARVCDRCKEPNPESSNFCGKCGHEISS